MFKKRFLGYLFSHPVDLEVMKSSSDWERNAVKSVIIAEWCLEKKIAFQCVSVKLYDNCEQNEFLPQCRTISVKK